MKNIKTIVIVCLVVLIGTVSIVSAISGNSLSRVLDKAGETLGALLYSDVSEQVVVDSAILTIGSAQSAGTTQSTQKIAQQALDITTITAAFLLNSSGQDRIITNMKVWYESSQSTTHDNGSGGGSGGTGEAAITFDVTTSSDQYTVNSTHLLANNQAFPTSTGANILTPQITNVDSPTGLTDATARIWLNGEYLNMVLTATPTQSTSTGWFAVEYYVR